MTNSWRDLESLISQFALNRLMTLAYITCRDEKEARKISLHLLEKKLIACSNMLPINSMYRWNGKIADDKEFLVIAKTTEKKFGLMEKEVEKIHSYEVPCIIKIKCSENKKYRDWVLDSVK